MIGVCDFCKGDKELIDEITGSSLTMNKFGFLMFDNSSEEYPKGVISVDYCPKCGKKM